MINYFLSKSQYLRGIQCHKSLWLLKNREHLRKEISISEKINFEEGRQIETLAQKLFPDGVKIEYEASSLNEKITETKSLIDSGIETIYEATFQYDNVLVMVDILHKVNNGWELYEIKSSTEPKEDHKDDIAVQLYVLKGCGVALNKINLIHINKQYERNGDLDLKQLFSIVDLTSETLQKQEEVKENLVLMRNDLGNESPKIDIGLHCIKPYECDFKDYCWSHIPDNSIFNLSRLENRKRFDLYSRGIVNLQELPEGYNLTPFQQAQVRAECQGKNTINKKALRKFINKEIRFPIYFLDFETTQQTIPPFNGLRPNTAYPFQYSLHYLEHNSSELKHKEFLAKAGVDPRKEIVERLIQDIPTDVCVLAYNAGFEKGKIKLLADQFPEYNSQLMNIYDHIVDLMIPFQKGIIYKKEQKGSYSIKHVLPAFLDNNSELSYESLKITNGLEASNTFLKLHLIKDADEVENKRKELLTYCKLDTHAMVKLLKKIIELVDQ